MIADPLDRLDRLTRWVRDLGFPIVVAAVLLWSTMHLLPARFDKLIEALEVKEAQDQVRQDRRDAQQERIIESLSRLLERPR